MLAPGPNGSAPDEPILRCGADAYADDCEILGELRLSGAPELIAEALIGELVGGNMIAPIPIPTPTAIGIGIGIGIPGAIMGDCTRCDERTSTPPCAGPKPYCPGAGAIPGRTPEPTPPPMVGGGPNPATTPG